MSDVSVNQSAANSSTTNASATARDAIMPAVEVVEDASGITLYADLPGVAREKLVLNVERETLTIEGEVSLPLQSELQALHVELESPRYRRVFSLSRELDGDKIEAEFRHGVLKLHIPKAAHAQPRKINVQIH